MTATSDPDRLAVLVHEVRSPVAALSAIAEALADGDDAGLDRRDLARLAVAACHGIERVVVDAALASVRLHPLDVGTLVSETVASARLRGGYVEATVHGDLPPVSGDVVRLRQALDNLVENALTWSPPGKAVVVGARSAEGGIDLSVADQGPGIPPAEKERIFERGVRLDPARPGSGLGLVIVRAIVEAHGGSISVESERGTGATFHLRLPAS